MSDPSTSSLLSAATTAAQTPYTIVPVHPTVAASTQWQNPVSHTIPAVPTLPETPSASVFADPPQETAPAPVSHPFVAVPAAPVTQAVSVPQMQVAQAAPVAAPAPDQGTMIEEFTEQVSLTVPSSVAPNEGWPTVPFRQGTPWTIQLFKAQCLSCTGINPWPSATLVYEEQKCSRADSCPAGSIKFSAIGLVRVLTKALMDAKATQDPLTIATAMNTVATRQGLSDEDRQSIFRECGFL